MSVITGSTSWVMCVKKSWAGDGTCDLRHASERYPSDETLIAFLKDPKAFVPGTAMPSYYQVGQRTDPRDPRFGEPRLSAQEIENLIAYLKRQK